MPFERNEDGAGVRFNNWLYTAMIKPLMQRHRVLPPLRRASAEGGFAICMFSKIFNGGMP